MTPQEAYERDKDKLAGLSEFEKYELAFLAGMQHGQDEMLLAAAEVERAKSLLDPTPDPDFDEQGQRSVPESPARPESPCEFCGSWVYLHHGKYRCGQECAQFVAKYGTYDATNRMREQERRA